MAARRKLLAAAANEFLNSLVEGQIPEQVLAPQIEERELVGIPGSIDSDEEEQLLKECNDWVVQQGLPEGELGFELTDEEDQTIAILDLAWPDGLQEGLSQPVALLIDEGRDTQEATNSQGYRFFTDVDRFREYVSSEVIGA